MAHIVGGSDAVDDANVVLALCIRFFVHTPGRQIIGYIGIMEKNMEMTTVGFHGL